MNLPRTLTVSLLTIVATKSLTGQSRHTVQPDLESGKVSAEWVLDGSGKWELRDGSLILSAPGRQQGPIRRPTALALLRAAAMVDATVDAWIRSTAPADNPRADMLVVFGYQSPAEFYYVHLSGVTDAVHSGIFVVNHADRRRIDEGTGEPPLTDRDWHQVRLVRDDSSGRIAVYVDGAPTPRFTAVDTTFSGGAIGFGSFDDTGEIRDIVVTGRR